MDETRNIPAAEEQPAAVVSNTAPAPDTKAPAPALSAASRALPKKPAVPKEPPQPTTATVVDVRFKSGGKVYYFDPGKLVIPAGAHVIIDTSRGLEYGICAAGNHTVPIEDVVQPLRPVVRVATLQDEHSLEENKAKESQAFAICSQKILEHGLEMKLVSVEYAFDGSKILFFFTADGRVDFRELVKDLASVFRTRIELRQIGVRDEAKMLGGLGICGRPFCCSQFLDDFQPVSIKMAKTQNLSLNPTKISGACGRLMCCLKYEQEAYEDLVKTSPKAESFVDTPEGRGTVTDVNLLRQQVTVRMEDDPTTTKCFRNCDICVLRNGKAKKNDPPIPKDLAPISTVPHPAEPPAPDPFLMPEPVLISQFSDSLEETAPPAQQSHSEPAGKQAQQERSSQNHARSRHRANAAKGQQKAHKKSQPSKSAAGKSDQLQSPADKSGDQAHKSGSQRKKRSSYYRSNYRRRSHSGGQENSGQE